MRIEREMHAESLLPPGELFLGKDGEYVKEKIKEDFLLKIQGMHGKSLEQTSSLERYLALAGVIRDYIAADWMKTEEAYEEQQAKQVYYFSIEFLPGRMLGSNLLNMGLREWCREALSELNVKLHELEDMEEDPGLGNGGLGRLAACYLDSMAAQGLPGHGCGIRYRYGLFEQRVVNGYQEEYPDNWLKVDYPWEIRRGEEAVPVRFGGNVRMEANGRLRFIHENAQLVMAIPYDVPVVGYKNGTVNTLRLWSAQVPINENTSAIKLRQECLHSSEYKRDVEAISDILYPDDSIYEGKMLRLKQQYFLVSAGMQSILRSFSGQYEDLRRLPEKVAIHINDTHPTLVIPECMRLLMDEHGFGWDEAWEITTKTMSYTNHTILPEALERWPVELIQNLLPRMYMIINEINERFCRQLWDAYPGDWGRIREMAIVADGQVQMAHLAIAGSHSVNGVAKLHTQILMRQVMSPFYELSPEKFNNKTNGITHRRWLMKCNPMLADTINQAIGTGWHDYPCELAALVPYARDAAFRQSIAKVKGHNKAILAKYIQDRYEVKVDIQSMFDIHAKRIHAYKRQLLNVLHIMDLYNRLKAEPFLEVEPRTFIFAGKAAPGYYIAKRVITLIHRLAEVINKDKTIRDKFKVVFLENYNVSMAELLMPAADVSEQIPTASREACGTGNMKFMMNGALTIGTLDGANIEIRDAVGDDNIVIFGLTANEVLDYYRYGGYNPWDIYHSDLRVKVVMEQLVNGFLGADRDEFRAIYDSVLHHGDYYFVLKDFSAYAQGHSQLDESFKRPEEWRRKCVYNIAHSGKFSSDRTFTEYAMDIWHLQPEQPVRCFCSGEEVASLSGCKEQQRGLLF